MVFLSVGYHMKLAHLGNGKFYSKRVEQLMWGNRPWNCTIASKNKINKKSILVWYKNKEEMLHFWLCTEIFCGLVWAPVYCSTFFFSRFRLVLTHPLLQLQSHVASLRDGQFMMLQTCSNLSIVNSCKSHATQLLAGEVMRSPHLYMKTCRANLPIVSGSCCCPQAQTWCSVLTCHGALLCCHFLESHITLWTIFPARMQWGSQHAHSL